MYIYIRIYPALPKYSNEKGNVLTESTVNLEIRPFSPRPPPRGRTDASVSPGLIIKPQFCDSRRQIMGIIIRARFVGSSRRDGGHVDVPAGGVL